MSSSARTSAASGALVAAGAALERLAVGHGLSPLEATRFRFTA